MLSPLEDLAVAVTGQFNFNKFSSCAVVFLIITGPGTSLTSNVICFGLGLWGPWTYILQDPRLEISVPP